MNQQDNSAAQEWKSGWTLVLAASVGFSFFSVMLATGSIYFEPWIKEFGWSRTLLSSGPSIATVTTAVLSPAVGMLIDRIGARRIVLPGVLLTIGTVSAFSLLNGVQAQWFALWFFFGLTAVMIKSTPWTAAVVGLFKQARGLALGLILSGTAFAQMVVPPLAEMLIEEFGWRASFVWLGVGWGGITFILALLFFFDAHARAAKRSAAEIAASPVVDLPGLTVHQAVRNWALWRVAISNFVVLLLTIGLIYHLFAILTDAGVARATAAWLMSLSGMAGIAGKLVSGVLLDRFKPNWIGGLTLGMAAITFAILIWGIASPVLIVLAVVVNGYASGTQIQIVGYLTAGFAGLKNFGVIYGTMSALFALASGVGPLLAGRIYDVTGGYEPFFVLGAIGCVLGGLLIFSLPRYPNWEKQPDTEAVFD
jgi:predicted MFS family arabinose efflux permease